jgi:hypothetical protein
MSTKEVFTVVGALVVRPHLWWVAVRQFGRAVPRRWWTRFPFLPLPSVDYLRFRLKTAYGGDGSVMTTGRPGEDLAEDVVAWLEWCRA